ncbi:PEPxxWA-CTERM sorting domain-containing protein [Sandarakinorhabdus sp.]|uniref:PEPxxWA-CTERM sorting domain-containing protein n=1 Tax=Sandarakinorhabdus sp. TaxID=1916663 RepID=UPI003F6F7F66
MTKPILLAGALAAATVLATPAFAIGSTFGLASREDFETYDPGPMAFQFCDGSIPTTSPDWCLGILSGGSIALGTPQLPASSGSNVYVGTSILFDIADPISFDWPGAAFTLSTGSSPVQIIMQGWNMDAYDIGEEPYFVNFQLTVPAFTPLFRVINGTDQNHTQVVRFTIESASEFAIDDVQMGLPNTPFGLPEPSTWLMLILGFGTVGTAMRRRRAIGLAAKRISV